MKVDVRIDQLKPIKSDSGEMEISKHHLILNGSTWLHSLLCAIEKKPEHPLTVFVTYRHFIALTLIFKSEEDVGLAYNEIQKFINATKLTDFYCFERNERLAGKWSVYDPIQDFKRMGFGASNENWRISTINQDYQFCPTYPSLIGVPRKISDNTLRHIAKFRSKGRIPALSYIHTNSASITRSAQPMVGLKQTRSIQDEKLIEAIFQTSSNPATHLIIDARPITNALAQTAMGAGTENADNYPNTKILFLGIENIHVVRESFQKLHEACTSFEGGLMHVLLEKSWWLKHIKTIIDGSSIIVQSVERGLHVLIHCRTAQLSSLAQLCLDPYYRTIDGLTVLLEKEWISFGHKFKDRCGHLGKETIPVEKEKWQGKHVFGVASKLFNSLTTPSLNTHSTMNSAESLSPNNISPREVSPVFLQFLDCLYQIWKQFPTSFEFDEILLEFLFTSCYSCEYGNFLFNNERETTQFRASGLTIQESTTSIWQYIQLNKSKYLNGLYTPTNRVLFPQSNNLSYWPSVYFKSSALLDEVVVLSTTSEDHLDPNLPMTKLAVLDDTISVNPWI